MKFKAIVRVEIEYDVDLSLYGTDDVEEALNIDRENMNEDPFLFLQSVNANWETSIELVKEDE
jgi:hypothetical protein